MKLSGKKRATDRRLAVGVLIILGLIAGSSALVMATPAPAALIPTDLTWQQVHNSPGVFWYTVDFPTDQIGYAIGGPDWNVNSGIGTVTVAKTTDGGQTWTASAVPNTNRFMRGLDCTDANNCWIAGASSPRIQRTTNGGSTWTEAYNNADWSGWLWSTGWTGNATTVMIGTTGYANEPGRRANFLRSTNGTNFFGVIANDPREFVVYDFSCPVAGTCYAAAKQTAFKTTDDGASWTRKALPSGRYYGIDCTDTNTCWEVGGHNSSTSDGVQYIYKTSNGGTDWQLATATPLSGNRPRFWNVDMVDATHGFAVGCSNAPDPVLEVCAGQGLIYRTDDGVNWVQIPSPTNVDIMDVRASSMEDVVIVDWSGKIWRGTSGPPPTPTPTPSPYDVNNDGVVDILDITLVASHWEP